MNIIRDEYYGKYFVDDEAYLLSLSRIERERLLTQLPKLVGNRLNDVMVKIEKIGNIEKYKIMESDTLLKQTFVSLDKHLCTALKNEGIYTYNDVLRLSRKEVEAIPNIGITNINNLISDLEYLDLPARQLSKDDHQFDNLIREIIAA